MTDFIVKIVCVYLAAVGFGIIVNLPHKALNSAGFVGVIGWLVYYMMMQVNGGLGSANFLGGLTIGVCSIVFARIKKMPAILFDVPGLVPLVPGGQAYNSIKSFATGHYEAAFSYLSEVIWIAGSIALGFIVAELCLKIDNKVRRAIRLRRVKRR
ncbi:threonine/serine exporter family protein [Lentilactobacillus kosonis]|uniref:Integral membrane protein n=1 Tax=Lentilactobacillus kosonis TaxID=2810561 RepID=A0A401FLN8_9LACO|nr:threonine/serine exporter family protein [Lentilactobacillus kosonis]GAY73295.1 integral membrane protein [Lentilactobacillus kosonis]